MSTGALKTTALISIEEGRRFIWRDENDSSRDGILVDAINDASDSIASYCRREFLPRVENTARSFSYDGSGFLDLGRYDLRNVDEIKLYTDRPVASQVTLTTTNYRLWPIGGALGGTSLGLSLPTPSIEEFDYGFGWQVTLTGDWGVFASVADVHGDLKLACKHWAKNIVEVPGAYSSYSQSGYTVNPDVPFAGGAGMPRAAQHRLEDWRRKDSSPLQVIRFRHPDWQPAVPHTLPTV